MRAWFPTCDYDRAWAEFSWDEARRRLDGLPGGAGLNIAHEAVEFLGAIDRALQAPGSL